jgi:hypothetical protein
MNREVAFGRLLAIANVLSQRVFDKDTMTISQKHMTRYGRKPKLTFERIHAEIMQHANKFGPDEFQLLDMFQEILSEMDESGFTNEPLKPQYLHAYHTEQHTLNNVMGVEEASDLWGLKPGTIKNYCADGIVQAKKIGQTWVIDKNQPKPKKGETQK